MANMVSKAEKNALSVSYDVLGSHVELDLDFVKRYLVRGQPDRISDQEIVFFMNTCKAQKLNPLVAGEVYCIKFGNDPAQMVVGKGAYLRRAFEHPEYLGKEDGITVLRGNDVIQKEGCCLYPNETLIGGWCRVHYMRGNVPLTAFKEVALSEYDKGQANWKTKPASMINKVAVSQCVREAFPKDYEGLYSEEEMVASGAIPTSAIQNDAPKTTPPTKEDVVDINPDDLLITQEQRKLLTWIALKCCNVSGEDFKALVNENGAATTEDLTVGGCRNMIRSLLNKEQLGWAVEALRENDKPEYAAALEELVAGIELDDAPEYEPENDGE